MELTQDGMLRPEAGRVVPLADQNGRLLDQPAGAGPPGRDLDGAVRRPPQPLGARPGRRPGGPPELTTERAEARISSPAAPDRLEGPGEVERRTRTKDVYGIGPDV